MSNINLDSYRAMMGRYNLGAIELVEGKDGQSRLTKVDHHESGLFGKLFNAVKIGEGSHVGRNLAARRALLKAFRDDITAKYGLAENDNGKLEFLRRAELELLGANSTKALMRNEVVAKLLDAYDEARLAWKPLTSRSISMVADEKTHVLSGREKKISNWVDRNMALCSNGVKCFSKDDLDAIAFLADISAAEVETLFKTRAGAIMAFVNADVRLSGLNNPTPELAKALASGELDERQLGLVALQRAIYYVKTGDVPDDLKKAMRLDERPQQPEVILNLDVEVRLEPLKVDENVEVRQEQPKVDAQQPQELPKVENRVEVKDAEPKEQKNPVEAALEKIAKLAQNHQNDAEKFETKFQKMLTQVVGNSCEPYATEIRNGCPMEQFRAGLAEVIAQKDEALAKAQKDLEALKNEGCGEKELEASVETIVTAARGKCSAVDTFINGVTGGEGKIEEICAAKAKEIYLELKKSQDPNDKLLLAKNNFYLQASGLGRGLEDSLTRLGSDLCLLEDAYNIKAAGNCGVNPDFADACLKHLLGWPADSKEPIPENLQKPEVFDTLTRLVKACFESQNEFVTLRIGGIDGCNLHTGRNTYFKGLVDLLASGELAGVSDDRLRILLMSCALNEDPDHTFGGGNNPVELMKTLRNAGMTLNTLPLVKKDGSVDDNSVTALAVIKQMNGGSLYRLDAFCERVFGKRGDELTTNEVNDKYGEWQAGKIVDPLKKLPKVEQEAVKFVTGDLKFFERLGKGGDAAVKENMTALMDAVRNLNSGKAGDSVAVTFRGCKFTLSRGENGGLSVTIGKVGLTIPSRFAAGELLASLESELFAHAKDFGLDMVRQQFPEPNDTSPAAREKFLRVAVAFTGINALELSRVPTDVLKKFAIDLANGQNPDPAVRFADYLNSAYKLDNQAELEALLKPAPEGGQQPVENAPVEAPAENRLKSISTDNIYDVNATNVIRSWKDASVEDKNAIVFNQPPKTDEQKVHDFIADLVFNEEPWTYDSFRGKGGSERIKDVFTKHTDTIVLLMRNPSLITDAIDVEKFGLEEKDVKFHFGGEEITLSGLKSKLTLMFTGLKTLVNQHFKVNGKSDLGNEISPENPLDEEEFSELSKALANLFDVASGGEDKIGEYVDKLYGIGDIQAEINKLQAQYDESKAFLDNAALKMAQGKLKLAQPLVMVAKTIISTLGNLDGMISEAVDSMADFVQKKITEGVENMLASVDTGKSKEPVWQQTLDDLQKAGVIDPGSGYGLFLKNSAKIYFAGMTADDRRQLLAAGIRYSVMTKKAEKDENAEGVKKSEEAKRAEETERRNNLVSAFVKGLGPLMQKILQGIPAAMIPEEFQGVVKDVKSRLAPIPVEYVKAQLLQIKQKSGDKIESIEVMKVLGAASVGEALLCRVKTKDNPYGEEVVVKILRPESKTRLLREEMIFKTAAKAAGEGMAITYEGQLARIKEEFDFLLEADNIARGAAYEAPEFSAKNDDKFPTVHSMKAHPLCPPSTDVLMLEKAPGTTVDGLLDGLEKDRAAKIKEATVEVPGQKARKFKTLTDYENTRRMLQNQYNEIRNHQYNVKQLASVWLEEAIFRGGFFHGDLHAGNMMVDKKHGVTVIDYGNVTKLSKQEQTAMMRMAVYSSTQMADKFLDTFISTLTPAGKAKLANPELKATVLENIKEVFAKGTSDDVAARMFGAFAVIQRADIETPASVYNFMQSLMRLAGTIESMSAELNKIKDSLATLLPPDFGVPESTLDRFGDIRAALAQGKSADEVGNACQAAAGFYKVENQDFVNAYASVVERGDQAIEDEILHVLRQYLDFDLLPHDRETVVLTLEAYAKLTTSEERKNFAKTNIRPKFANAMNSFALKVQRAVELGQNLEKPYEFIDAVKNRLSMSRLFAYLPFTDTITLGVSEKSLHAKAEKERERDAIDTKGVRNEYAKKNGGPSIVVQSVLDWRLDGGFRWLLFPRRFFTQIAASGWTSDPGTLWAFKKVFAVNFADLVSEVRDKVKPSPDDQELRRSVGYIVTHHLQRFPELAKTVKDLSPDSFEALKKALTEKNPADADDVAYGQTAVDFLDALLDS